MATVKAFFKVSKLSVFGKTIDCVTTIRAVATQLAFATYFGNPAQNIYNDLYGIWIDAPGLSVCA